MGAWYTHVSVQGRVVEVVDDAGLAGIDRISRHDTGDDDPNRTGPRALARGEVDCWHGRGAAKRD